MQVINVSRMKRTVSDKNWKESKAARLISVYK
jgi:hypothetical protein